MQQRPDYRAGRFERAVKVYTVCDESRFLIARNVPALGCVDELLKLFGLYGDIEEYRLLDEEDCEPYTDVYWIKYVKYSNARFAKRKLDNYKFLGNLLDVSYGPNYESLNDTKNKLEDRRRAVLNRIQVLNNQGTGVRPRGEQRPASQLTDPLLGHSFDAEQYPPVSVDSLPGTSGGGNDAVGSNNLGITHPMPVIGTDYSSKHQDAISESMNKTVQLVRAKLNRISEVKISPPIIFQQEGSGGLVEQEAKSKRPVPEDLSIGKTKRQDNRRRI
ncbi:unnamed protein product [Calypogeia fissa]